MLGTKCILTALGLISTLVSAQTSSFDTSSYATEAASSDASLTSAASSSAAVATASATPYITGQYTGGYLFWSVYVPGALGEWSSISYSGKGEGYTVAGGYARVGSGVLASEITTDGANVEISTTATTTSDLVLNLSYFATLNASDTTTQSYKSAGVLTITFADGTVTKRAVSTFEFSSTIANPNYAGSSSEASSSSSFDVSSYASEAASSDASLTSAYAYSSASSSDTSSYATDAASSDASLTSAAASPTPYITGQYTRGYLFWSVYVPGALGEWSSISYSGKGEGYTVAGGYARVGSGVLDADITTDGANVEISTSANTTSDLVLNLSYFATLDASDTTTEYYKTDGILTITFVDGTVVKRATSTFEFSSTIDNPNYVGSSSSSSDSYSSSEYSSIASDSYSSSEYSSSSSDYSSSEYSSITSDYSSSTSSYSYESSTLDVSSLASEAASSSEWYASSSSASAASASSGVVSATETPYITGQFTQGFLFWTVYVPGSLGAWTSVEYNADGANYELQTGYVRIGSEVQESEISAAGAAISISTTSQVDSGVFLILSYFAPLDGSDTTTPSFTTTGLLSITFPDDKKLIKRATSTFDLSSTIENPYYAGSSSSSDGSSSSEAYYSSTASDYAASSTLESSWSSSNLSATATDYYETSASSEEYTTIWGTSIVTETIGGVVTSYVTYCPVSTETKPAPSVETITSTSTGYNSTETITITKTKAYPSESTEIYVSTTTYSNGSESTETVYVTKTYYPSSESSGSTATVETVTAGESSSAVVSTFAGAGNKLTSSFVLGLVSSFFFLF